MRKIVEMIVDCQKPVRSHCGTKLLFVAVEHDYSLSSSLFELYIVNIDGSDLTFIDQITYRGFGCLGWSPDDRQVFYVKRPFHYEDNSEIILYDISEKTYTVLQTEGNACSPSFSPDGKQIAYCTSVGNSHHIYKMDVDGSNQQMIISNAGSPKWSPQGDKIAYSSSGKEGSSQISVANADGTNQKQLTNTISPRKWPGWPTDGNSDPQWTPDGKKIVYVSFENEKSEIFIMNVDGSEKTRLTKAEIKDESPEITPDGKYILFSSSRSDLDWNSGIFMMTLDGKNQKNLSKTGIYPIACR